MLPLVLATVSDDVQRLVHGVRVEHQGEGLNDGGRNVPVTQRWGREAHRLRKAVRHVVPGHARGERPRERLAGACWEIRRKDERAEDAHRPKRFQPRDGPAGQLIAHSAKR